MKQNGINENAKSTHLNGLPPARLPAVGKTTARRGCVNYACIMFGNDYFNRMNTATEKPASGQSGEKRTTKKASTNEIPMIDLGVVLEFVKRIETDGLQTLAAQEVAKRTGYTAPTSTPFYRRMAGAKLFGLLDTTQGVNLTNLALDYFKPTDDESKAKALVTAIKNVVGYQKILDRFSGKRLPQVDILAHLIEREFNLADEAAKICAGVFVSSVQRAGLVQADNTLTAGLPQRPQPSAAPEAVSTKTTPQGSSAFQIPAADDCESHYLTLDAKRGRRVVLQAPPVITASELKRVQNWLSVQFHVVETLEELASGARVLTENDSEKNPPET